MHTSSQRSHAVGRSRLLMGVLVLGSLSALGIAAILAGGVGLADYQTLNDQAASLLVIAAIAWTVGAGLLGSGRLRSGSSSLFLALVGSAAAVAAAGLSSETLQTGYLLVGLGVAATMGVVAATAKLLKNSPAVQC